MNRINMNKHMTSVRHLHLLLSLLALSLAALFRTGSAGIADWAAEGQRQLIERHPGSEKAVARALKMAIVECQFQMRHDPWNCPVYNISTRPSDVFGKLMLHNFKESSFVRSLLSSAIAHSIARACTENRIASCESSFREGMFRENIEFGKLFAEQFMEASSPPHYHLLHHNHIRHHTPSSAKSTSSSSLSLIKNPALDSNTIDRASGISNDLVPAPQTTNSQLSHNNNNNNNPKQPLTPMDKLERELKIRSLINAHNDKLGRNHVERGMSRACKCHGLSGACTSHTCWHKLPQFREVAKKLHDSLVKAVRILPQVYSSAGGSDSPKRHPVARSIRGARSSKSAASGAGLGRPAGMLSKIMPKEDDLLYFDESPDFCVANPVYNIKGTKGRTCSEDPNASNSCRQLCCGRGYKKETRLESTKCNCHFKYCCYLACDDCPELKTVYRCL